MELAERRHLEREARKQTILDAATEVFGSSGYTETAMEAIATRAKVNIATVYYYYASKEILYLAVLVTAMERGLPDFQRTVENATSAREKLRAMSRAYSAFHARHPDLLVVVRSRGSNGHAEQDEGRQLASQALSSALRALEIVRKTLCEGAEAGELRTTDEADETALLLWSALDGVLRIGSLAGRGSEQEREAALERWIDLVLEGLVAR